MSLSGSKCSLSFLGLSEFLYRLYKLIKLCLANPDSIPAPYLFKIFCDVFALRTRSFSKGYDAFSISVEFCMHYVMFWTKYSTILYTTVQFMYVLGRMSRISITQRLCEKVGTEIC